MTFITDISNKFGLPGIALVSGLAATATALTVYGTEVGLNSAIQKNKWIFALVAATSGIGVGVLVYNLSGGKFNIP